ncbi:leucine-rich repeat-containing protein 34 isoform X1 [Epinephelus fuscoguttatus]|uniref:leucine-rich repeat-containing protein 34 isoform X1 n=1 Tax=Epinephelus fuscoguttatus TaxID=293821 RepID=UPI0020D11CA3|nr:leucine-rich repeat-containing protein 34 isoform X1 [Epinephelus fuscoguttatus]
MAKENISDFYAAFCAEHEIKINPHILQVLETTTETENTILKLTSNNRLRRVQRLDDKDVLALSKCLRNNKSVAGLDVSYNNISDEGVGHLADLLQEESLALHSLNLMFNNIQTDGAEVLAKSLQCNSTLVSLSLSGNKIENRGAMHLASMLQVNTSLRELELANCDLATQSVIAFAIMLKSNKTLCSVDISRPLLFSHQEEWAVHFSEMLAVNSSLVELHLGKMGMTDTGMERLTEGLRLNHSLRYLDLCCNRVTRDGVHHLAKLLKQNLTLEVIDLSCNRIEDEGAVYLSEALTWPGCVLRELSVSSNNIRTEGLLSLAHALTVNTSLNHIYIWGNHLEETVCQAFRDLIASGRLPPEQTDVSAYEVDGQVFLAEVFHCLRRHYCNTNSSATDTSPNSDTATDLLTHHTASSDFTSAPHTESQQLVPLQSC